MTAYHPDDLNRYSSLLRMKNGYTVNVRIIRTCDRQNLQIYVSSLSQLSRYNRFSGAINELPNSELDRFIGGDEAHRFTMVATMVIDASEIIVGEAQSNFIAETSSVELALSVADRFQRQGIGAALLRHLEDSAASSGARRIFGDTLSANIPLIGLARKSGYSAIAGCGDWRLVRFAKEIRVEP
jgi:GNAT superfamily N-acetyltransferase